MKETMKFNNREILVFEEGLSQIQTGSTKFRLSVAKIVQAMSEAKNIFIKLAQTDDEDVIKYLRGEVEVKENASEELKTKAEAFMKQYNEVLGEFSDIDIEKIPEDILPDTLPETVETSFGSYPLVEVMLFPFLKSE